MFEKWHMVVLYGFSLHDCNATRRIKGSFRYSYIDYNIEVCNWYEACITAVLPHGFYLPDGSKFTVFLNEHIQKQKKNTKTKKK